jgi:predicted nucleic acid-binding protein
MIFVDTGYLLAVLNPRDELYARAQAWSAAIQERLITTEYVVWELVNSLSDPVDRPKAHTAVAEVLSSSESWELVYATPQLFSEGLSLHQQRRDKHWSLTDCVSFVVMRQRYVQQSLSFDRHFEQAGYEALLRRDPT